MKQFNNSLLVKALFAVFLVPIIIVIQSSILPHDACAAIFKPANLSSCPDGSIPDFNSCPDPAGDNLTYCVRSAEVEVTLYFTGTPQEGTIIKVDSHVEPLICSYTTCLKRQDSKTIIVTPEILQQIQNTGQITLPYNDMLQYGCGGPACNNFLKVDVTINSPSGLAACTITNSDVTTSFSNIPPVLPGKFWITCPPPPSPTPTPTSIPETPTPTFCPVPQVVPNVRVSCPSCASGGTGGVEPTRGGFLPTTTPTASPTSGLRR